MKLNELSQKSRDIVIALGQGHSCEKILARNRTLTYHDIFRAAAEIRTNDSADPASRMRQSLRGTD